MEKTSTPKKVSYGFFFLCSFLLTTLCCSAQWVQKANGIITRSEVTSVVYNEKLYTFLGFRDSQLNVESSSEVYDPANNTWTLLSSIPSGKAMTHQGVVLVDGTAWHIGGRVGKHPGPLTSETWIYNITTDAWSPGPQLLDPATGKQLLWGGGGAALLGRTLHIFGGFIHNSCNNDQSTYHLTLDVDQWLANPTQPAPWRNKLAPMPVKRNHFSTVVLGGKIYAIGGQFGHDCGGGQDKQYSHVYNPATNTWTELPLMPTPRSHAEGSAFAMDGKIYIVAGQATKGANTNSVTVFDPAARNGSGAWYDDTNLTLLKRYEGLSAKVINNTFIISHGGEGSSNNTRKTTYTRTLARTPVDKFGFLPACSSLFLNLGSSAKTNTLLFTIDGRKDYTLSSNVHWLTVTKNRTGTAIQNAVDIETTINTEGLAPGTYTGTITVTGTGNGPAYTTAQYCVNLTVKGPDGLEAENALLYRVKADSKHPGFTGSGFADYINSTDDYIEWTANRPSASDVLLQFRYANGSPADRPLKVEVNGAVLTSSLSFPPTGGWTAWATASVKATLTAGSNKIRLTATGKSGANVDKMVVLTPNTLEAENAVLYRVNVDNNHAGFTGTGFADYSNSTGDYIEWTSNQSGAGPVTLQFRYANSAATDRPLRLEVNGMVVSSSLPFPPTGSWTAWRTVSLTANLNAGSNKIRLTAIGGSGANLDHLKIWPGTLPAARVTTLQVQANKNIPEEIPTDFRIAVAPNPASGFTKLQWNLVADAPVAISITDALGVIRKSFVIKNNPNGQVDLMLPDLPDGLYIIDVRQGKEQASTKLLIRKNQ